MFPNTQRFPSSMAAATSLLLTFELPLTFIAAPCNEKNRDLCGNSRLKPHFFVVFARFLGCWSGCGSLGARMSWCLCRLPSHTNKNTGTSTSSEKFKKSNQPVMKRILTNTWNQNQCQCPSTDNLPPSLLASTSQM